MNDFIDMTKIEVNVELFDDEESLVFAKAQVIFPDRKRPSNIDLLTYGGGDILLGFDDANSEFMDALSVQDMAELVDLIVGAFKKTYPAFNVFQFFKKRRPDFSFAESFERTGAFNGLGEFLKREEEGLKLNE